MNVSDLPLVPMGATGILALVVLAILRGALIPRSVHEDRMKDKDAQIEYLLRTNQELTVANSALLEVGYTTEKVLTSLQAVAGKTEGDRREVASS
jgi:hypothetical protein